MSDFGSGNESDYLDEVDAGRDEDTKAFQEARYNRLINNIKNAFEREPTKYELLALSTLPVPPDYPRYLRNREGVKLRCNKKALQILIDCQIHENINCLHEAGSLLKIVFQQPAPVSYNNFYTMSSSPAGSQGMSHQNTTNRTLSNPYKPLEATRSLIEPGNGIDGPSAHTSLRRNTVGYNPAQPSYLRHLPVEIATALPYPSGNSDSGDPWSPNQLPSFGAATRMTPSPAKRAFSSTYPTSSPMAYSEVDSTPFPKRRGRSLRSTKRKTIGKNANEHAAGLDNATQSDTAGGIHGGTVGDENLTGAKQEYSQDYSKYYLFLAEKNGMKLDQTPKEEETPYKASISPYTPVTPLRNLQVSSSAGLPAAATTPTRQSYRYHDTLQQSDPSPYQPVQRYMQPNVPQITLLPQNSYAAFPKLELYQQLMGEKKLKEKLLHKPDSSPDNFAHAAAQNAPTSICQLQGQRPGYQRFPAAPFAGRDVFLGDVQPYIAARGGSNTEVSFSNEGSSLPGSARYAPDQRQLNNFDPNQPPVYPQASGHSGLATEPRTEVQELFEANREKSPLNSIYPEPLADYQSEGASSCQLLPNINQLYTGTAANYKPFDPSHFPDRPIHLPPIPRDVISGIPYKPKPKRKPDFILVKRKTPLKSWVRKQQAIEEMAAQKPTTPKPVIPQPTTPQPLTPQPLTEQPASPRRTDTPRPPIYDFSSPAGRLADQATLSNMMSGNYSQFFKSAEEEKKWKEDAVAQAMAERGTTSKYQLKKEAAERKRLEKKKEKKKNDDK